MNFTESQQQCIDTTDRNLIVSAGAGAGKTAVLIERIFRLLAEGESPCSIDQLLVATFSRAAASEMKERLSRRIRDAIADDATPETLRDHLREQLLQMPRASISTIHSFCLSVITAYPDRIGLSPGFDLMSEEETRLFHREFFQEKIEDALSQDAPITSAIRRLLEEYDPIGGLRRVLGDVLAFHRFLESLPRPGLYRQACAAMHEPSGKDPSSHPALKLIGAFAKSIMEELRDGAEALLSIANGGLHEKFDPQVDYLNGLVKSLGTRLSSEEPLENFEDELENLKFPRLSSARAILTENDERFKAARESFAKDLKTAQARLAGLSGGALQADLGSSRQLVMALLDTVGGPWSEELFEKHMQARRLTFSQLERLALRILVNDDDSPSDVALILRTQYRHVLVDEFQDTNEMQEMILRAICRPASSTAGGNRFVVGDVKQSIYEFRLAEPTLFLGLYRQSQPHDPNAAGFPDTRISLLENFRSHPELLSEFNRIFSLILREGTIGVEYAEGHAFVAGRSPGEKARRPELSVTILPSTRDSDPDGEEDDDVTVEAEHVARRIAEMGPPWRDICILLRSTVGNATDLVEALQRRNVPTFTDSRLGFLTAVEILEFQAILKTVHNPYNETDLLATLRGPAFRWNEDDLLKLRIVDRRAFYIDILRRIAASTDFDLSLRAREFVETLDRWQALSQSLSMTDFFAALYDELHLVERAAVRPGGDQRRLNLLHLLDRARQFDRFLTKGLGPFLQFLDDLIENGDDFAPPSALPEDADVVRIMTVHKSKGMQFPVVFLPFMGRRFNEMNLSQPFLFDKEHGVAAKLRDARGGEDAPPALYEAMRFVRRRKERAEELRLLYVALTRAQESVHLSGSEKDPAEALEELRNLPKGPPSPAQIIGARRAIDWVHPYLASRFAMPEPDGGIAAAGAGIARVALHLSAPSAAAESGENRGEDAVVITPETTARFIAAMERIRDVYTAVPEPTLRAKISVTEAKRAYDATHDPETPHYPGARTATKEKKSSFQFRAKRKGGAEKGHATHRFLALCELAPISLAKRSLSEERNRLVQERLLTEEEAGLVMLPEIGWFLGTELGKQLRVMNGRERRELPFTVRIDSDEIGPSTRPRPIILQGVADLLFPGPNGWVLVDYKTDYCGENNSRLGALIESYSPQIALYRVAAERTLGVPIAESWLVFMQGRALAPVPPADSLPVAWQKIVEAGAVFFGEPERRVTTPREV